MKYKEEFTHETLDAPFLEDFLKIFREYKAEHEGFREHYTEIPEDSITADALLMDGILKTGNFNEYQTAGMKHPDGKYMVNLGEFKRLNDLDPRFMLLLLKRFPKCSIQKSGHFYYPPNTGMYWHTNADNPYLRCYINYSENADSYFKYYDQGKKETVVDNDFVGWNIRTFRIEKAASKLFWHSVYSRCDRLSIGFKVINNLK
tara:strand:+ start:1006 stop:1614 length:609 start_codon:yes stop_codon:yes gene_type:complete